MRLLVDTSVWSLAFRSNAPSTLPKIRRLAQALRDGEQVYTTGLVIQELLQGFSDDAARDAILTRFRALPQVVPEGSDYVAAAELQSRLSDEGVRLGTIDALIARLEDDKEETWVKNRAAKLLNMNRQARRHDLNFRHFSSL